MFAFHLQVLSVGLLSEYFNYTRFPYKFAFMANAYTFQYFIPNFYENFVLLFSI